jgi:hypothetical protein
LGSGRFGLAVVEVFLVERADSIGTGFRIIFGSRRWQRANTHYRESVVWHGRLSKVEALNRQSLILPLGFLDHE